MNDGTKETRGRRWLRLVLALLGVMALVLVLEGGLSFKHMTSVTSRDSKPVPVDHRHTDFHRRFGWVASPGISTRDGYGAWRTLHTNRDGLREDAASAGASAEAARLMACLGGSAAFGVGVGDDETWCRRLGFMDADFRTVNLGQPAYGAGQSLLHYREFGAVEHDVVLLALDDETINQIVRERHKRFAKPVFSMAGGSLEIGNTPVPRSSYLWRWATVNRDSLATSRILDWLMPDFRPDMEPDSGTAGFVLFDQIIAELKAQMDEREGTLVVVYLPKRETLGGGGHWAPFLEGEADQREIPFINLVGPALDLPVQLRQALFDPQGYLTPFAHSFLAEGLAERLGDAVALEAFDRDGARPWLARYYQDLDFIKPVGEEWHAQPSLDWAGGAPHPGVAAAGFGATFDSCLPLSQPERLRVLLEADGRAQIAINGQTILHSGSGEEMLQRVNTVSLPAGSNHVRVRYMEEGGPASMRLLVEWEKDRASVAGPGRFVAPQVVQGRVRCEG